jgi:hypothetical protein
MHPHFSEALVRERQTDLLCAAGPRIRSHRVVTARRRLGWVFVELGLRLAAGQVEAGASSELQTT